jgi:hypothetical protein
MVDMPDLSQNLSIAEPRIAASATAGDLIANVRTTARGRWPSATALLSDAGARPTHSLDEAVGEGRSVKTLLPTADVVNPVILKGTAAGFPPRRQCGHR